MISNGCASGENIRYATWQRSAVQLLLLLDEPIAVVVAFDLAGPRDVEGENEAGISRSLVQEPDTGCDRLVGHHVHGAQPPRMGKVRLVEDSIGLVALEHVKGAEALLRFYGGDRRS